MICGVDMKTYRLTLQFSFVAVDDIEAKEIAADIVQRPNAYIRPVGLLTPKPPEGGVEVSLKVQETFDNKPPRRLRDEGIIE